MFFRYCSVLFFILFSLSLVSKDILKDRILEYNNVEKVNRKIKLDSQFLVGPYKYYYNDYTETHSSKIIVEKRKTSFEFGILISIGLIILIRYFLSVLGINLISILRNFFNLSFIENNLNIAVVAVFVFFFIAFISLLVFIVLYHYSDHMKLIELQDSISRIGIIVSVFIVLKYLVISILNYIFTSKEKYFKKNNALFSEFIVSFVILFLPILIYVSLFSNSINNTSIVFIISYCALSFIFFKIKLSVNNFANILKSPIYSVFYLFAIELIPLFLLFKFFYFIVNNGEIS